MSRLRQEKIIAIVRGLKRESLLPLAQALLDGGISLIEVTFDQSHPELWGETCASIRALAEQFRGAILPGAGTVLNREQLLLAKEAGARYIISPDCNESVIRATKEQNLVSLPGAMTPTEIVRAYEAGADAVKVFPADHLGPSYFKAVRAPLSHIPLMAVGGVNAENAASFLAAGCVGVGVGGSLTNRNWIEAGEFDKITELAKRFRQAVEA